MPSVRKFFKHLLKINRERLIETGYPRNDFISNATKEECDAIKNKYHLPIDKKLYCMHQHGEIILMFLQDILLN